MNSQDSPAEGEAGTMTGLTRRRMLVLTVACALCPAPAAPEPPASEPDGPTLKQLYRERAWSCVPWAARPGQCAPGGMSWNRPPTF